MFMQPFFTRYEAKWTQSHMILWAIHSNMLCILRGVNAQPVAVFFCGEVVAQPISHHVYNKGSEFKTTNILIFKLKWHS
jgi:hypothetical protein